MGSRLCWWPWLRYDYPIRRHYAVVDVGPDNHPLPLADRLTRCITGTAKAGEVNLSWQVLTHIPWTDKERGLVHTGLGATSGPPIRRPLHIVGIAPGSINC
jgi:hypothetical protein